MHNNTSILEIRKLQFIEKPNYDNCEKLLTKIDTHKEIFDNKFFAEATKNASLKKDIKGLLFIAQLYIELNRNVEAEYILFRAYEIDNANDEIIYYLFDVLCRRKQLGLASYFIEKFDRAKNALLFTKSMIKYFLLTNRKEELNELITSCFEIFKNDKEFIFLVYISAIQNDNHQYTYMVSKTKFRQEIFYGLSGQNKHRIKNHFYRIILILLREKMHGSKNC